MNNNANKCVGPEIYEIGCYAAELCSEGVMSTAVIVLIIRVVGCVLLRRGSVDFIRK